MRSGAQQAAVWVRASGAGPAGAAGAAENASELEEELSLQNWRPLDSG